MMSLLPSWQFKSENVLGYIVGGGEHGVQIATTADGKPGTRPMCMNLEHYYSRSCGGGLFVPRYKAMVQSEQIAEDTVRIQIAPYEDWSIQTTINFQLLPGTVVEARYEFLFQKSFRGFEVLVSNYFHTPIEPYLHVNGRWQQPKLTDREHRYWARGADEAENIRTVCYPEVKSEEDIDLPIDDVNFDFPIMVTPILNSEQSIINIVEAEHCSSLSANRRWNAHDFSLIAKDVAEGEKIVCRAWLCCTKLGTLDDALHLAERVRRTGVA